MGGALGQLPYYACICICEVAYRQTQAVLQFELSQTFHSKAVNREENYSSPNLI